MINRIPFNSLSRQAVAFSEPVERRLAEVMARGIFVMGPEVEEFERRFAAFVGVRYAVGVANGTQAMELALKAIVTEPGEVITVANAGMYATCAILAAGLLPIFCEIDPVRMTLDPESLSAAINKRTRAVIVVHLYGQVADMDKIIKICHSAGLPLIEDCAEAHGACWHGQKVGSLGLTGCFSFYPTKNLGAYGDGGAVTTNDAEVAERLRSLRQYGWIRKYHAERPGGINSRLDEIQAAVLNVKLDRLGAMNERRRQISVRYNQALSGRGKYLPFCVDENFVVHHHVLRSSRRTQVMQALAEKGVACEIHFPVPDHRQPGVGTRARFGTLPQTDMACREIFSVPCFPQMNDLEVDQVSNALVESY